MIKSITITPVFGESVELELWHPEKSEIAVKSIDGLGPVTATVNMAAIANSDGGLFTSAFAGTRNIVMDLVFVGNDIESVRRKTYLFFPLKSKVDISVKTDGGDYHTSGYIESNEPDIFSNQEGCSVSIVCESSYWMSGSSSSILESSNKGLFEFPFSSNIDGLVVNDVRYSDRGDIVFGEIKDRTEFNIYYDGGAETGITFTIRTYRGMKDIVITNDTVDEFLKITADSIPTIIGTDIIDGEEIIINTNVGERGITYVRSDGNQFDIINALDLSSTWLQLHSGRNVFNVSIDNVTGASYVSVDFIEQYQGV